MKLTKSKLKEIIREELQKINEADLEKTAIPADVKRFMNRFIDKVRGKNLNKIKQVSILIIFPSFNHESHSKKSPTFGCITSLSFSSLSF